MKKQTDLSALENKIAHKSLRKSVHKRFECADEVLDVGNDTREERGKIIRKSYALTDEDVENIRQIKEKCLNRRVVLNDSHIVRMALKLTSALSEEVLVKASTETPKLVAGRPRVK